MFNVSFRGVLLATCVAGVCAASSHTFLDLPGIDPWNRASLNNNGYVASGRTVTDGRNTVTVSVFPNQRLTGIDDASNYVGQYWNGTQVQGFHGTPGNVQSYTAAGSVWIWGVSGNGQLAGYVEQNGMQRMFIAHNGVSTYFDYPGPHAQQYLWDINNAGDSVGLTHCCNVGTSFLRTAAGNYRAISVPGYADTDIVAYGLNDQGTVVGGAWDGTRERGFVWRNGNATLFDVPGAAHTRLFDINDSGVLFGGYTNAANQTAFIATPNEVPMQETPEPGTMSLLAAGMGVLTITIRRRRRAPDQTLVKHRHR